MATPRQNRATRAEPDVQPDNQVLSDAPTGGVPDPDQPDRHSTTGTTPNGEFVGRVGGDDPGYVGETGAERRAQTDDEPSSTEDSFPASDPPATY